ncbi:hypothetical protein [Archangium sp.]|uniref:hypothetical protein n=1 Tax=Archangium sp. TaxID=1872627 RepID=UPI00389A02DB
MAEIRWTKQQDFCLRLGLLKALVALMPRERRSMTRDAILTKVGTVLFSRLSTIPTLRDAAQHSVGGALSDLETDKKPLTIADGLLMTSGLSSWGQPIDDKTKAKILEWAQNIGFVGQGNQITERALLLRSFFDETAIARFAAGNPLAWNPFYISPVEQAFFFFHLGEHDELLWNLAFTVGQLGTGTEINAAMARSMLAQAMREFVARLQSTVTMSQVLELRTIRELSQSISAEMEPDRGVNKRLAHSKGPSALLRPRTNSKRATTKNADHQTIPRFEILVDLGFLEKRTPLELHGKALDRARSSWTYHVTEVAARFSEALAKIGELPVGNWHWKHFAYALGATGLVTTQPVRVAKPEEAFQIFYKSYDKVERRAGHTPFVSVALLTMLNALAHGLVVEIEELHSVLMRAKRGGELSHCLYFAAGNEPDKMFILIRPAFEKSIAAFLSSEAQS